MPVKPWGTLMDEAGDTEFDVLPASDYDLKIIQSAATQSSNGKLMFKITSEVQTGPYKGRRIWGNIVLSPDNPTALNIFFRQMAALGISKEYFAGNPSDSQVADALMNRTFRGQIIIKPYQGTDRNEIRAYHPPRVEGATPPAPTPPPVVTTPQVLSSPAAPPIAPSQPMAPPVAAAATPPVPAPDLPPPPPPVSQPAVPPVPDVEPEPPHAPPAPTPAPSTEGSGSLPPKPPF